MKKQPKKPAKTKTTAKTQNKKFSIPNPIENPDDWRAAPNPLKKGKGKKDRQKNTQPSPSPSTAHATTTHERQLKQGIKNSYKLVAKWLRLIELSKKKKK